MKAYNPLTDGPIVPALLKLAFPIILSSLLQSAYQVVDTFWVGRLSEQAVAAVSLCFPVVFLMIAIGGGLPIAGTVLIAQYKGRGDTKAVNHVAAQTFMLIVAISLVLSTIGYLNAESIMRFMGAAPDVLADATMFIKITFLGYIFVFGYFAFESLMRGFGEVYLPMKIVFVTVILNLVLDPFFIFGYGPIPPMGVAGAAMATLCTQALATFIGCIVLFSGRYGIHLKRADLRPDVAFMKKAFFIGLPSSIEQSARALGMTAMTMLVASYGTVVVAAYGIGIRLLILVIIPALGLSVATSAFVGQNIGAGKIARAERGTVIGSALGFVALLIIGLILYMVARPLALFFVPDGGEAIDISVQFVRIMALSFGFISLQMVIIGTFRGAGQTTLAMMMAIIGQWGIQVPLAYYLAFQTSLGYVGIWWSFTISNVLSAALVVIWFLRGKWKHVKLLEKMDLERRVHDEIVVEEDTRS